MINILNIELIFYKYIKNIHFLRVIVIYIFSVCIKWIFIHHLTQMFAQHMRVMILAKFY